MRVGLKIKKFPLILFPVVDEFVSVSANSLVNSGVIITGVVLVAVIEAGSPVRRLLAFQERQKAATLHVLRDS